MFEECELQQLRRIIREELRAALASQQAQLNSGPDFLSISEAANIAHVGERTIRTWQKDGKLRRCGHGKTVLIELADLQAFLLTPESRPDDQLTPDEWVQRQVAKQKAKEMKA